MGDDQQPRPPAHRWLAWVGIREPPPDEQAWVPVASFEVEDRDDGTSARAADLVRSLSDAGIRAEQRPYMVPDVRVSWFTSGPAVNDRIRVAVLVHSRDVERATRLSHEREATIPELEPISDEELTRLAMEQVDDPEH